MIKSRQYFSDLHLGAAVEMAQLLASKPSEQQRGAFALGAIFLSVAFLEAKISELLADAIDNPSEEQMLSEVASLLAQGAPIPDKQPTLDKYQQTLHGCKREQFDKGSDPFQSAALAIRVRNALIHYKPEWVTSNQPRNLDTALKAKLQDSYSLNVTPKGTWSDFIGGFPHECLTRTYALWTIRACSSFDDDFFVRMDPLLDDWVWAERDRLANLIAPI